MSWFISGATGLAIVGGTFVGGAMGAQCGDALVGAMGCTGAAQQATVECASLMGSITGLIGTVRTVVKSPGNHLAVFDQGECDSVNDVS